MEDRPKDLEALEQLKRDYRAVFNSDKGKKILKDLERRCFFKSPTISDSPTQMAFREGKRSVLLHILSLMELDIERLKKLQGEE